MKERRTWLYAFARIITPVILKLPFGYRIVKGKNNIPKEGRFIVCSNHISILDPIWLAMGQKRQIYYMAKDELFKNKFLAWILRNYGAFGVKREKTDAQAINKAFGILRENRVMGIFPEGTRSRDGELLQGKAGAAMIAFKENSPVIPAAIYAKDGKAGIFKKVYVAFGEPLSPEELGITEGKGTALREATRAIMTRIAELRQDCIDYSNSKGVKFGNKNS